MRLQKLLIIVLLFGSIIAAYYINKWLQKIIKPRESFGQLILYMLTCFAMVFGFTFLIIIVISKLFPIAKP